MPELNQIAPSAPASGFLANRILSSQDNVLGLQLFEPEDAFDPCVSCASCNVSFGSTGSAS